MGMFNLNIAVEVSRDTEYWHLQKLFQPRTFVILNVIKYRLNLCYIKVNMYILILNDRSKIFNLYMCSI